jgi:hypothetical protein
LHANLYLEKELEEVYKKKDKKELFSIAKKLHDGVVSIDAEYDKEGDGVIKKSVATGEHKSGRPDFIVHQRGDKENKDKNNYAYIEAKKEAASASDKSKCVLAGTELGYRFAVCIHNLKIKTKVRISVCYIDCSDETQLAKFRHYDSNEGSIHISESF